MEIKLRNYLLALRDGIAVGLVTGIGVAIFLILLDKASSLFLLNRNLLFALPLCGALIGWLYQKFGGIADQGNHLILDEIHNPKRKIPFAMAPLILVTTVLTHLFGGSAGREGTAIQIGSALAERLGINLGLTPKRRKHLLICGMGAGFGAAIGTPIAGAIFAMEVLHIGRIKIQAIIESLSASFCAYYIAHLLQAPHSSYPPVFFNFDLKLCILLIVASLVFAALARMFIIFTHSIQSYSTKLIPNPILRPSLLSLILIALFIIEGTTRFNGLGIGVIQNSFLFNSEYSVPLLKIVFTALTIGIGFRGGEFTPLAFIGATAGSALAGFAPESTSLLACLGFAAVFGAASKTPLACTLMAAELFGWNTFAFALPVCLIAYYASGNRSIYQFQHTV